MSNKEKQIKINLENWKTLSRVISHFRNAYGITVSYGKVVDSIMENINKEDLIKWTKQNLKN